MNNVLLMQHGERVAQLKRYLKNLFNGNFTFRQRKTLCVFRDNIILAELTNLRDIRRINPGDFLNSIVRDFTRFLYVLFSIRFAEYDLAFLG